MQEHPLDLVQGLLGFLLSLYLGLGCSDLIYNLKTFRKNLFRKDSSHDAIFPTTYDAAAEPSDTFFDSKHGGNGWQCQGVVLSEMLQEMCELLC